MGSENSCFGHWHSQEGKAAERRLVGEELRRSLQVIEQPLMDRPQMSGGTTDPIGERRAVAC
jgi:hypothetical protein